MDAAAFRRGDRLAGSLPVTGGSVEINTHPGEAGDPDLGRFDWGYRWSDELAMLLRPGHPCPGRQPRLHPGFLPGPDRRCGTVIGC